jgi:Fic family protein
MLDNNWETVNGPVAHRIEVLNATNQINVLEGLVTFLLAHRGPFQNGVPAMPDEASLKQLHRAGTMFLLASPGEYRNHEVHVGDAEGNVRHQPPPWQLVPGLMQQFFRQLSSLWASGDALDVAAYTLWGINWVHPFRNGNGRTARAFSYACLSLKIGGILPGTTTVIDQIMANRGRYEAALQVADESFANDPHVPNLDPMRAFLDELLQIQISSIPQADDEYPGTSA